MIPTICTHTHSDASFIKTLFLLPIQLFMWQILHKEQNLLGSSSKTRFMISSMSIVALTSISFTSPVIYHNTIISIFRHGTPATKEFLTCLVPFLFVGYFFLQCLFIHIHYITNSPLLAQNLKAFVLYQPTDQWNKSK